MQSNSQKKSGFVSIIGKPNTGKSTLLNAILGLNLSVVTSKPQTTRNKILGIYTNENIQIVLLDTPGILKPKYKLHAFMKREIESSFLEADVILLVVDAGKYDLDDLKQINDKYDKEFKSHSVFCVLNKIDLVNKEVLIKIIDDISGKFHFREIVTLSAKKRFNIDELLKTISKYIPENDFYFDSEIFTSHPEKFFVSEIIRAQALNLYREEVPFSVYVDIDEFKERDNGKDFIRANIILEKDSQKKIVIGNKGTMIKLLGQKARKDIEEFLGRKIFLELFVKVKKNWKDDEKFLNQKFHSLSKATSLDSFN